jgi:hypothetical protein
METLIWIFHVSLEQIYSVAVGQQDHKLSDQKYPARANNTPSPQGSYAVLSNLRKDVASRWQLNYCEKY